MSDRLIAAAIAATVVAGTLALPTALANPIPAENLRPPTTKWLAPEATPPSIEGYSSTVSAVPGETITFHVSTNPAASYRILVYRLGWYGGSGGTHVACLPSCASDFVGSAQPVAPPFGVFDEVRANWPGSAALTIPASWVSGYYVANLMLTSGPEAGRVDWVPFIVREAGRRSQVIAQVPVNTWQAYNGWGGKSLYEHSSTGSTRAVAVSFDRPYFIGAGRQEMTDWEIALVRWLEREGYDVSYQTNVDTHRDPAGLIAHRLVLTLGHDEYWTKEMRDGFEAARDSGTNLGFLGANAAYWQVRYANNERTIISYKSLHDPEPRIDLKTALFREVGRPECALIGVQHQGGLQNWGRHDYFVTAGGASDPWAAGTGFVEGSRITNVVSVERDDVPAIGCGSPTVLFRYDAGGDTFGDAAAVRYTAGSGARVFGAGTMELGWALDSWPSPAEGTARVDPRLQKFMANAMDDLGRPAPARGVVAQASGRDLQITVAGNGDQRVRWDVYRGRAGADDPGWRLVCRGVTNGCLDRRPPAGNHVYAAEGVDAWTKSVRALSSPVRVRVQSAIRRRDRILLSARRRGNWDVFDVAPDGTGLRNLTRHPARDVGPAWSPDGSRIVFGRVADDGADDGLYVMEANGGGAVRIKAGGYLLWPKWSRDGRTISFLEPTSFSSFGWDGASFRLHRVSADGGDVRTVADGNDASYDAWSWSPNGKEIALHRLDRRQRMQIVIVHIARGRTRTLTRGSHPVWSHVGRRIAFTFSGGIHVIRPDGTARRRVTRGDDHSCVWSPDDGRLAFKRETPDRRNHVYVVGVDGSSLRRVFTTRRDINGPLVWSPDGRRLAWSLDHNPPGVVYVARTDGRGTPRRLTNGFVTGWSSVAAPSP